MFTTVAAWGGVFPTGTGTSVSEAVGAARPTTTGWVTRRSCGAGVATPVAAADGRRSMSCSVSMIDGVPGGFGPLCFGLAEL